MLPQRLLNCLHQQPDGSRAGAPGDQHFSALSWRLVGLSLMLAIDLTVHSRSRSPFHIITLVPPTCIECEPLIKYVSMAAANARKSHMFGIIAKES